MSKLALEEKIVFGVSPDGQGDGVPLVLLGIPKSAWEYMRDGKTHMFDLTKAGLPIKLVLYGGTDHAEVMGVMDKAMRATGSPYRNELRSDFSIKPKDGSDTK